MLSIGVLALQGAFREHAACLSSLGAGVKEVRLPTDLEGIQGLIIPGGESTTMARLMTEYNMWDAIQSFSSSGGAIFGTCAGAIALASEIDGFSPNLGTQRSLGLIDATVKRNAFGRQVDSFTAPVSVLGIQDPFDAVFIRAPVITRVGSAAEVLARYKDEIVLAKEGKIMISSFHPELTSDTRIHKLFLDTIK